MTTMRATRMTVLGAAVWLSSASAIAQVPEKPCDNLRAWRTIRLMKTTRQLTAIIEREDDAYVAFCPEVDIASQGDTVESARKNLIEALELFFESADPTEVLADYTAKYS